MKSLTANHRDLALDKAAQDAARVSSSNFLDRGPDRPAPMMPVILDSYFLKILDEIPLVIPKECFQDAGLSKIQEYPIRCPLFGWRSGLFLVLYLESCRI
jgi:hypothetical protein